MVAQKRDYDLSWSKSQPSIAGRGATGVTATKVAPDESTQM
jgi:hypothetical protein